MEAYLFRGLNQSTGAPNIIKGDVPEADEPQALSSEETPKTKEEWTLFESRKKHRECADAVKTREQKAV